VKDYYQILGVEEKADKDQIKKAYRSLAKKWHPDRCDDPAATEKFQEINEPYSVLSNEQKRQEYEYMRSGGPQVRFTTSGPDFGFGSSIHDIFDRFRQHSQQQRQAVYNVSCTLEEAYTGTVKTVNGVMLTVPKGVRDGSLLQANEELYRIRIAPHSRFIRDGDHLVVKMEIDAFDAMVGTTITVNHLDQKTYTVTVPEGTQYGQMLKIAGKGMANPQVPHRVGDFYIVCEVKIPKNLTSEQKSRIMQYVYTPKQYTI
jgi:curved DNA-binding protein